MEDFFGNVPDIVIDIILGKLPIRMAAQTSVLSKQWRRAWLSLKSLIFGLDFLIQHLIKGVSFDWRKYSHIISNILLHHKGSVEEFSLYFTPDAGRDRINPSSWISFLSNNGVRMLTIRSLYAKTDISSYIFWCRELVRLELEGFSICSLPTDFSGFPNLKQLVLDDIHFKQNIFSSLIEKCRMLETLKLVDWSGMDHVVIHAPSLQTLILNGDFESLAFRNLHSLKTISLGLNTIPNKLVTVKIVDAVNLLANSCQLQSITFDGHLLKVKMRPSRKENYFLSVTYFARHPEIPSACACKFFAAGGIIKSSSVTFNHLKELCLSNLSLNEFGVLRDLLSMIECCPYIKKLDISVISGEIVGQDIVLFNYNYKLNHLREVIFSGITGSSAELTLVEYLLAISTVLENLFMKCGKLGIESKLKMLSALMGFPRASPKARLLLLEK